MTRETAPFVPAEQDTRPREPLRQPPPGAGRPPAAQPFPDEFRLLRWLGGGTFGDVWLAEDLSPLARLVALKFLRGQERPDVEARALAVLENDARLLAAVDHPNVVQVHSWRRPTAPAPGFQGPCLVLQYVSGGSLEDRVRREGPLPWQLAGRYVADVADGLLLVHRRGIVHRDVKPANILWEPDRNEAVLTDFGIAARLGGPPSEAGTPLFMAPEAFGGALGPALDVYSLAASLFWLVSGQPPFLADDRPGLLEAIRRGLPSPDRRCAGLPADLERLVRAGLDAEPGRRPELAEFARGLRGALNQLLADTLPQAPAPAAGGGPVNLRLLVSREVDRCTVEPVASSEAPAERLVRDFKKVPPRPRRVTLHTGDRVRVEVEADRPGYVTVFNVGPTGNLNLLHPPDPAAPPPPLGPGRPLRILEVELTPPAGQERLFALWTRQPLPLRLEELRSLVERGEAPGAGAYRATRDMARVQQSVQQLRPEDRHAVVLELDHH
jgi:serine/threonine protein kinase